MSILLGLSGLLIPGSSMANAADGMDKTNAVDKLSPVVTQGGKELGDTIDPDKPFEIQMDFKFSVINDEQIGTPVANGLTQDTQINDGDYAIFELGKNFKPKDPSGTKVPVRIKAPGTEDDGKQIGTLTLTQGSDRSVTARMDFHSPDGKFKYETDGRRDIAVTFTGEFSAAAGEGSEPGSQQDVVKIFDKDYKLPKVVEEINYNFTKKGGIVDPAKRDEILWTVEVNKKSNTGKNLAGEKFTDDLSGVGEYVDGSFKVNETAVDGVYNAETKTLTYEFPEGFDQPKATIAFATKVADPKIPEVKNVAKLSYSHEDFKTAEAKVPVYQKPKISKSFSGVEVDKDTGDKAMIWTIVAGTPYFNYGSAWVGDILRTELGDQKAPKRQELTVEHSLSGKDGDWKLVSEENIETLSAEGAKAFPKFPAGKDAPCPNTSAYTKEVYDLGLGWNAGTREADPKYKELQNHWLFIKELNGQYRFTVKLIFDKDDEVGKLQNDAEIHTCGDVIFPVTPPVYSGEATITKKALKTYENDVLNQGNIPWSITTDFSKVFPSEHRYVYELFYYGSEDGYKNEKGLNVKDAALPEGTLEALLKGVDGKTVVNFNQNYLDGSLEPGEGDNLAAKTFPLFNEEGKQVGELVQISGFTEVKSYSFKLKTHVRDLLDLMGESGSYSKTYKNTAVLVTGNGDSLKALKSSAKYELEGRLLDKYTIESDTDLNNIDNVSKNGWDSGYRDFVTGVPLVDETKTFNYKDRTAMFRIDVNPTGLKFSEYANSVGASGKWVSKNWSVTDVLPEGLSLVPLTKGGSDYFAIYEADPITPGFIDHGGVTVADSTDFVTFMPSARAKKKVTADEAKVTFDKDKLTWNFSDYEGTPYFIVVKAQMSEEVFSTLVKNAVQSKFETYRNKVSLKADDKNLANDGADLKIKPYLLTKEDPKVNGSKLDWTFTYKPFDQDFKDVVIEDELDKNIAISLDEEGQPNLDDFKVRRSNELLENGDYKNLTKAEDGKEDSAVVKLVKGDPKDGEVGISYDAATHKILFKLPNTPADTKPYAYKVEYPTMLRIVNPDAEKIVNKVKALASNVKPEASGEGSIDAQKYAAFATLKGMPYVALKKVDNKGTALSGAVFSYQDAEGNTVTTVSDGDGMVYAVNLPENTVEITELKAPEGFVKLSQPIVIGIAEKPYTVESGLTQVKGEGSFDNPFEVPNEVKPEEPTKPSEPSEPSEPGKTTPPSSPSQTTGKPGTGLSKTGVSDATLPLGIAALVLLAAGIVVVRRTH
ncbi:prealbumin-like fold domain-containing protein [Gleimia europaea]|uniref:prealbumin-like fold domain-containing protein n=1 Tax=Gleimia europaea TaxID=66228 RepID=UPI0027D8630D|nr:prealbumin-like fold domain-containing protein [Gleimia europaea]